MALIAKCALTEILPDAVARALNLQRLRGSYAGEFPA
jgi:hypothetical protein